jgi:carbamate kinase
MRIVAALGGNALLRRGEPLDQRTQRRNASAAAAVLAPLAAEHELVVTHGNGPQIGLLALQAELDRDHGPTPFDVLGAESEGAIGYVLAQELMNALPGRPVATLLTQTIVAADDPRLLDPTKPIGPVYEAGAGAALAAQCGWAMRPDGAGVRRVVGSPLPLDLVELPVIAMLVRSGVLVICAGGGGVPVIREAGGLRGVEAVVDKDLTAALLAERLEADVLLLLTDVEGVLVDGDALAAVTPADLEALDLPAGSMGPKAAAAGRFVTRTGRRAAIGSLTDAVALAAGEAGTQVRRAPATGAGSPQQPCGEQPMAGRASRRTLGL